MVHLDDTDGRRLAAPATLSSVAGNSSCGRRGTFPCRAVSGGFKCLSKTGKPIRPGVAERGTYAGTAAGLLLASPPPRGGHWERPAIFFQVPPELAVP